VKFSTESARLAQTGPENVIEDFGQPLVGFFLGALMIAITISGYFLWNNYHGGADAMATVSLNQH
jgi:hypothetical protein